MVDTKFQLELLEQADRVLSAMRQMVDLSFHPRIITDGNTCLPLYPPTGGLVDMARLLSEICTAAQKESVCDE